MTQRRPSSHRRPAGDPGGRPAGHGCGPHPLPGPGPAPRRRSTPHRQAAPEREAEFYVRVSVDRQYRIYGEGEILTLKVRCEEDAYLYVLYQQADGKIFQIFPNSGQPDNRIKARQDIQVPAADDAFRWVVGPPFGHEVVKVIASKKPVDALSLPGLKDDHFNPVTQEHVEGPAATREGAAQRLVGARPGDPDGAQGRADHPARGAQAVRGVLRGLRIRVQRRRDRPDQRGEGKLNLNFAGQDATDMSADAQGRRPADGPAAYRNQEATREQVKARDHRVAPLGLQPRRHGVHYFLGPRHPDPRRRQEEKDGKDEVLLTHRRHYFLGDG